MPLSATPASTLSRWLRRNFRSCMDLPAPSVRVTCGGALPRRLRQLARVRIRGARLLVPAEPGERHAEPEPRRRIVLLLDRRGGVPAGGEAEVVRAVGGIPRLD